MAIDERVMNNLLRNPNVSDVTDDVDVSEQVNVPAQELKLPVFAEQPENSIIFASMDGGKYCIDRNSINWEETAERIDVMEENVEMVRNMLMSVIFERCQNNSENDCNTSATEQTITVVRSFVEDFGLKPKYMETYPDAQVYDLAVCYCTDAIGLLQLILVEVAKYNVGKSVMDSLFTTLSEEEKTNENRVQEGTESAG